MFTLHISIFTDSSYIYIYIRKYIGIMTLLNLHIYTGSEENDEQKQFN